jgi:hypothetical protein
MTAQQTEDQQPAAGEQRKERVAAGCLAVIAIGTAGTIAVAVPETGYYVAGLITAAGVQRARTWAAGRRQNADETDADEQEPVDIVAVLQQLSEGGQHVRLTQLQEAAGLPDTKAVRALLDEAGIPVKRGVRTPGGNGPGVHHGDIPAPLPESGTPSGGCVCAGHAANANTNNETEEGPEKGLRVQRSDYGATYYDPAETQRRHHTIKA